MTVIEQEWKCERCDTHYGARLAPLYWCRPPRGLRRVPIDWPVTPDGRRAAYLPGESDPSECRNCGGGDFALVRERDLSGRPVAGTDPGECLWCYEEAFTGRRCDYHGEAAR